MMKILSSERTAALVLPALLLGGVGCSSGDHYMSEALESRPESELMIIEVSTTHDPGASWLARQDIPYVIDGVDVPYAWAASGNHVIYVEPGEHTYEGYARANVQVLPDPSDPSSLVLVYDLIYRYDDNIVDASSRALRSGNYGVRLATGDQYAISVQQNREVIEYQWSTDSRSRLAGITGTFSGPAGRYTWIDILAGMRDISFQVEQVAGRVTAGFNTTEFTIPLDGSTFEVEVIGDSFVEVQYYIDSLQGLSGNIEKTLSIREWWEQALQNDWQAY